jgi:hypothetical protein
MFAHKLALTTPFAIGAIIATDTVHPVIAVGLGALCAALGWSGYGLYLVGTDKLALRKFFATIGIAMLAGVVSVTFLPIDNFVQLLVACGLMGTVSEQVLRRARGGVLNMFGNQPSNDYDNQPPTRRRRNPAPDEDSPEG